jgi:L-lactate dehydrogenase complex protein LldG
MVEEAVMSDSKSVILKRIQNALGRSTSFESDPDDESLKRDYNHKSSLQKKDRTQLFIERVNEYKADVEKISEQSIGLNISELCDKSGLKTLVVPAGLNEEWLTEINPDITLLHDDPQLTKEELNSSDAVLTSCFLGVAQTGTIILDAGPGQGRRALTLLPDFHICIITESQIVGIFPEAIRQLNETVKTTGRPITMISGPSATSDIELNRVEGVHGPRKLQVFIACL